MPKAKLDHITVEPPGNVVALTVRSSPLAPLQGGGANPSTEGEFAAAIDDMALQWARCRQLREQPQQTAQVFEFPQHQAEAFRAPDAPAPAQPPRFPYKPPANTPPRRKPAKPSRKAADGAQASPQQNHAATPPAPRAPSHVPAVPDIRVMEKARLLAELAEAWGVDLRLVLAVAQQRHAIAGEG